jgi:hypothetical protein
MVFGAAKAPVATNEQKLAIRLEKDQGKVWAAGEKVNRDLATLAKPEAAAAPPPPSAGGRQLSASSAGIAGRTKNSYVEAVEDETVQKKLAERIAALEKAPADQKDAVGAVFCMNGKVQSAEIYAAAGLFRKLWPKLLRSAAVEAISREGRRGRPGALGGRRPRCSPIWKTAKGREPDGGQTDSPEERESVHTGADGKLLHRQVLTK